ncbi:hypothetical protein N480_23925 [Pseudoalteromonas luteoviolacea S2607]|uniref:hypothetical protein n=1 Tax=Pseudoalteromonas luteoviolacea TaxID=43657 RepID=UPI0007B0635C|nr:hypothetical protein [Pseudoalteromonas luteoviolacea]KZN33574.1 hypothetical protein N480_23925 [Pseudoalteromonas luteoviolacea S2607]
MKKLAIAASFVLFAGLSQAQSTTVVTADKVVKEVRVEVYHGNAYYYFASVDSNEAAANDANNTWEAPGCPSAIYAYIPASSPGAERMFDLAMHSKNTNTPLQFSGICGDHKGNNIYIQANYATF